MLHVHLYLSVYFTCIVKVMYNLLYYQVVVQICTSLTEYECDEIISKYSSEPMISVTGVSNLGAAIAFVLNNTMKCTLLRRESSDDEDTNSHINMVSLCCFKYAFQGRFFNLNKYRHVLVIENSTSESERCILESCFWVVVQHKNCWSNNGSINPVEYLMGKAPELISFYLNWLLYYCLHKIAKIFGSSVH